MSELCKCKYCGRHADLVKLSAGWTAECHYSSQMNAVIDRVAWCAKGAEVNVIAATDKMALSIWNTLNCKEAE